MTDPGRQPNEALHFQPQWCRVTLASIGDAVITTDTRGLVTFLNLAAVSLTGWTLEEATGQPLDSVFRIINEESRLPVESPTVQALRESVVVGLANHSLLITKNGTERPINDSAAPIRNDDGAVLQLVHEHDAGFLAMAQPLSWMVLLFTSAKVRGSTDYSCSYSSRFSHPLTTAAPARAFNAM